MILEIVDTAGNDDFSVLVDGWIGEGDGFLLVFSIIDSKGYNILNSKRARIVKVKEKAVPPMILIGNKCDLSDQRVVASADAKALAESWNSEYLETSAKVFLIFTLIGKN
jgi:small GTP-binding protein